MKVWDAVPDPLRNDTSAVAQQPNSEAIAKPSVYVANGVSPVSVCWIVYATPELYSPKTSHWLPWAAGPAE